MILLLLKFIYGIYIEVDDMNEELKNRIKNSIAEINKWEVYVVSFDLIEMKERIEPCELVINNDSDDNFKITVFIDNRDRILTDKLFFNLAIFPHYDSELAFRSATYIFKISASGHLKMIHIPSSIISLFIQISLLYRNIIKTGYVVLFPSNFNLCKNYLRAYLFYEPELFHLGLYGFELDYKEYMAYVLREIDCYYELKLHLAYFNSLFNILFARIEISISEIFDVIKEEIDHVVHIISDLSDRRELIEKIIMKLAGKEVSYKCSTQYRP
jgi:hypothetical protein